MSRVITYEREFSPFSVVKYFKVLREYAREDWKGENRIVVRKEITKEHYEHPIATEAGLI